MKPRHEYKYPVNNADIISLKSRLGALMQRDTHAGPNGQYTVRSLYFDNYTDKALREKIDGINQREKFRIRYYNDDTSFMNLEKKSKKNGMCYKEKAAITADQCRRIFKGDLSFLIESDIPLFKELYVKMRFGLLRPRCIVSYTRECFVYPAGNVRITIDTDICRSLNVRDFLNPDTLCIKPKSTKLLEIKYDEFLPEAVRNLVSLKCRRASAFSKYGAMRF